MAVDMSDMAMSMNSTTTDRGSVQCDQARRHRSMYMLGDESVQFLIDTDYWRTVRSASEVAARAKLDQRLRRSG